MTQLRSLTREQDRAKALMAAAISAGVTLPTGSALQEQMQRAHSLWINGPPLDFSEFCWEVAGVTLFDRQVDILDKPNLLRAEALFSPDRYINVWHLVFGKGSGKDMLASLFLTWLAYILAQFRENPRTHLSAVSGKSIAAATAIDLVNVSTSDEQALQVFFGYVKRWLLAPLFRNIPIYPKVEHMKPGTKHIEFPSCNVHLYSKSSKAGSVEGFNTLGFVVDEGDQMTDSLGVPNADLLYGTLHRTAIGRWGRCAVGLNISYARIEEGFMLRKEAEFLASNAKMIAEGKKPLYYVDKASTEEVRPDWNRQDPEIQAEYDADPAGASAMYDNKPMATEFAFFDDPDRVTNLVDENRPLIAVIENDLTYDAELEGGIPLRYIYAAASSFNRSPGCTYFLTVDAGRTGDAYGVCVGHTDSANQAAYWLCPNCGSDEGLRGLALYRQLERPEPLQLDETGNPLHPLVCGDCEGTAMELTPIYGNRRWWQRQETETKEVLLDGRRFHLPHWYEDLLIEVRPKRATRAGEINVQVSLQKMELLCRDLTRGLGVLQVRTDPWQTMQMVEGLRSSTQADVAEMLFSQPQQLLRARIYKAMLNANMMTFRANARRDREVRRIQLVRGVKIDHPQPNGSKDLYDVEAMNVFQACEYRCGSLGWGAE